MNLKGLTKGVGGSAINGGVGGAAFYLHRMLSEKVKIVQEKPLVAPIGLLVLGHILKSKPKFASAGAALCGVAGYAGAQIWEVRKATQATNPTTKGFDDSDTGALLQPGDVGALLQPGDVGAFDFEDTAGFNESASAYNDALSLGL